VEEAELRRLKQELVDACHVLAANGCVREITGHVSCRLPDSDQIVVRCRRPEDPGVEFTTLDDIRVVDLDGHGPDLPEGYEVPGEWAIHSEIYRVRPEVGAIVHAHPRFSLLCGILGLPFLPVFGAYDPPAMEIALSDVPVFPRAVLISTPELGRHVAQHMGEADLCLLRGHGVVSVGADIAEAVVRSIRLETLAEVTLQLKATGGTPQLLSDEDIKEVSGFISGRRPNAARMYTGWIWNFYRRKAGLG
jgi:ribulose-5-phosphate 4-epimerase/fuculose-1-phosphate aldolase